MILFIDATASLCSGLTAASALVSIAIDDYVWWLDGFLGMTIGMYIIYSGNTAIQGAQVLID
jgi:hypothetical protein